MRRLFKSLKSFFKWLAMLLVLFIAFLYLFDYEYVLKGVRVVYLKGHTTAYIDDHPHFENLPIANGNEQPWPKHLNYNKITATESLKEINKELGTIAFLIIKNDSILYENYIDGYGPESRTNSFSIAKSITSALLGKAIKDGYIESLDQPVGDFYDVYDNEKLTVGDLSSMASGLDWDESYSNPFGVTARAYYDDDLAETILNLKVVEEPGKEFKYLSGNTQLLGMVIQKATGKKLPDYLSESFWQPLGAEQRAIWQVDDEEHLLVKSYCCIASNARDFARIGKLYKNHGKWEGTQILDSAFVVKSVQPRFDASPQYGYGFWLSDHLGKNIFVMRGILGQYVITIPEDDLIIVRLGHNRGEKNELPFSTDFYVFVEEVYAMLGM
ncbi:MAG: beta-lactamase family protein [Bacteroidia bacterium]|nr:beta-lactamase family protein [Bacteroidia bacterium]NNM23029.1 serine hydrolase [Flavobacteriaceae bacterium]